MIEQAFDEFKEIVGVEIKAIASKGKSSDFAIITFGGQISDLFDQLSESDRKAKLIQINQLSPFPVKALVELMKGKKSFLPSIINANNAITDNNAMNNF